MGTGEALGCECPSLYQKDFSPRIIDQRGYRASVQRRARPIQRKLPRVPSHVQVVCRIITRSQVQQPSIKFDQAKRARACTRSYPKEN